ncbi:MAG: mechanosensitive ion channel family protein [Candidatus Pacearchaeota archaeon]|nr:mechanosensitive ion channel family protein [Candidatus Pacearchaeota archaeon]
MLEIINDYVQNEYIRALIILVVVFVVLKIFVFILEKIFSRATKKTKTDFDDKLIERTSKPFSFIVFLIGLRIALSELSFSPEVMGVVSKLIYSGIVFLVGYSFYVIVDLFVSFGWGKLSSKAKTKIDSSLSNLFRSVLKVLWVVFVMLYVLNLWGIEVGPFLAGLGIGGIAIAFAMQESLSNIFGGVSIILDKTVRVGDVVSLDTETAGSVLHVGFRSTKIKTFDNEVITVPNATLAQSRVQNLGQPEPKSRVVISFGVAYGSDISKVKKIVLSEIRKVRNLSSEPEPSVKFLEMADSSLNFKAYFFVDSFEFRLSAIDEANTRIYNALNKNKIEIPFPQMDVKIKK